MAAIDRPDGARLLESFGVDPEGTAPGDQLEARIEAWLRRLAPDLTAGAGLALGRIAWLRCGGPERWAAEFLAETPDPGFVAAFRAALPRTMPDAAPLAMPEQALHVRSRSRSRSRRGVAHSGPGIPAGRPEAVG